MPKFLIVEDDKRIATLLEDWLVGRGDIVDVAFDGAAGQEKLQFYKYDAIILDWDLPGKSGVSICREFRSRGGSTPILMLTGKSQIDDKEEGFNSGADDYLTKPFELREVSARLGALMRRPAAVNTTLLVAGDLSIDPGSRRVMKGSQKITLMPKEYALLEFLMRHQGQIFSNEALLDRVWSSDSDCTAESVRIAVARIRGKIDLAGQESLIKTIYRVGYKLDAG